MTAPSSYVQRGTVYGTLMNFRGEWNALDEQMHQPPYQAPPSAPVLYVKPANTFSANGAVVTLPPGVPQVEVGAAVAVVMQAPGQVAGYVLMNDLSVPHSSFFRPPVKYKCLDGFLVVGDTLAAASALDVSQLTLEVRINGSLKQTVQLRDLVRGAQQLLRDVGEFMTLGAGDAIMLGCDAGRPTARAGDAISIRAAGLGELTHTLTGATP